ncbi:hypothetical protein S40288_07059 [Stachybotrys chartarum IBT 40288]|nr:hypothetical protein S40288_07059 [Stachybotrys chartarum IBT 40288]
MSSSIHPTYDHEAPKARASLGTLSSSWWGGLDERFDAKRSDRVLPLFIRGLVPCCPLARSLSEKTTTRAGRHVPETIPAKGPAFLTNKSNTAPSSNGRTVCTFYSLGKCKYGDKCKNAHVDGKTRLSRPSPDGSIDKDKRPGGSESSALNWRLPSQAVVAINSKSDTKLLPKPDQIPAGLIAINRYKHRLDAYIVPPTTDAIQ